MFKTCGISRQNCKRLIGKLHKKFRFRPRGFTFCRTLYTAH